MILTSFILFTGLVAVLTWFITRKDDLTTNDGYFLAGRSLTFPLIAGSLLLTNLSTEQMVGLNADAFTNGLAVMVWEVAAVISLVFMAIFFLPRFLKSGIATVPQFLEERYSKTTQAICNFIFLLAYAFILLPIVLYTGANGLMEIMDLPTILNMEPGPETRQKIMVSMIVIVGIVGSIYALYGGLRTVAVSDTINGVGLLIGGLLITYFGFKYLGDGSLGEGITKFKNLEDDNPDIFNSIGKNDGPVPFSTVFTGIMLLNCFYWCTNQQIIQRTFGASSLSEGQKGVLLTGALKLLGPLYLVLPGILAFAIFKDHDIKSVQAYGKLVNTVLPNALSGFFAAVMLGAILSSFNSALNSTTTLFSYGVYKGILKPKASEKEMVRSGRIVGVFIAIIAMVVAPLLDRNQSIFGYLQNMNGMYFVPIFAVVLVGMLHRRVPAAAANCALILGVILIGCGFWLPDFKDVVASMHPFHYFGIVFIYLIIMMLVWSEISPRQEEWVQEDAKAVDLTPWKYANKVGLALIIIVLLIYAVFADFSSLTEFGQSATVATE